MSQDNPFAGLGDNPFSGLGQDPLAEASQPGASPSSSSWWDRIWRAPEFVMKPVKGALETVGLMDSSTLGSDEPNPFVMLGLSGMVPPHITEKFFGTAKPSTNQLLSAGKGAVAGAVEGGAESFLSPGNLTLMLVSGGTGIVAKQAIGAASKFRALAGVASVATVDAESVPKIFAALKEAEKAYGSAKFWTNIGAGVEGLAGGSMAAHGVPTLYEGVKERDLSKIASGIFEVGFGALGVAGARGRFIPGGPPGPGRPRKFYEGGGGPDEAIGPRPFEGLGTPEEVSSVGGSSEAPAPVPLEAKPLPVPEPVATSPVAEPAPVAAPDPIPVAVKPVAPAPIAPTPFDQPTGLPKHVAPSLRTLQTDIIEDPALRLQAEALGGKLAQLPVREIGRAPLPPELEPYREAIINLADDVNHAEHIGNVALQATREEYIHKLKGVPDGIWESPGELTGQAVVLQIHKGEIVGMAEAINGQTKFIAGGKAVDSPVSIRPLFEYMRAKFEPDTTVSAAGELTRRRKIRSYLEEQRKNGPPEAAAEGQTVAGEHDSTRGEVRPLDAEALPAEAGLTGLGGEEAPAPTVAGGFGASPERPVAAGAGGGAGGPPAEGVGGAAPVAAGAGGPPETVGALALDPNIPGGPPPAPSSGEPGGGLPKYAGAINLWRVLDTSSEDVAKLILETYRAHEPLIQAAQRGHIPIREQQEMADGLGLKLQDILKNAPGTAQPAEYLRATHAALVDSASLVLDIAAKYNPTKVESRAQLKRALASHVALQAKVSGLRAEAGRALGTLAHLSKAEARGDVAAVQGVTDAMGQGAQLDLIAELLAKISPDDVRAVNRFASKAIIPSTADKVYEYWLNSILSGPPTHLANILSNTIMVLEYPAETLLQAGAAHVISKVSGKPRDVYYGEALHQSLAITRGMREGVTAGLQAWRTERPVFGVNQTTEVLGQAGAIGGRTGKIIRSVGTRPLGAEDEFFKAVINRMSLNGRAYSLAASEGGGRAKVAQRMAELLENPPEALLRAAEKEALYRTFNKDPNSVGKAALTLRKELPGVRWVIPFIRTPINIVEFGGERLAHPGKIYTLGKAIVDYKAGRLDTRQLSAEVAKDLIGLMTVVGVGALVAEGRITGGGPTDPGERRTAAQALTGTSDYPAYSVKIGGQWYSYSRLEPLGITLGMTSDFIELNKLQDFDEVTARFMAAFRKNFGDKTWVSGLTGLFKAYSDEERYGKAWALRTISSFVPTLFATAARAGDPTRRLPEDLPGALAARIPGLTAGAPPAIGVFGEIEQSPLTAVERMFSPVMRRPGEGDPVAIKLRELDINVDVPSKKVSESILKELGVDSIPKDQLYTLRRARGLEVYGRLQQLLAEPGFSALPLEQQKKMLEHTISDARADVSKRARGFLRGREAMKLEELTLFPGLGGPPDF